MEVLRKLRQGIPGVNSQVNKVYDSFNIDDELTKINPVELLTSGKITANDIGKTVYLSNSYIACQEWIIADVNHDGTSGTVDLFSKTTLTNGTIQFSTTSQYYAGSNLDSYMSDIVYGGFSVEVKNALNYMNVTSNGYIQRYVVAPSMTELGYKVQSNNFYVEGSIYPIFSPAGEYNNKNRYIRPDGEPSTYWSRSRDTSYGYDKYVLGGGGHTYTNSYYVNNGMIARIRFAKA